MKQDIMCLLLAMFILLPGELAVATFGMVQQDELNFINFICWFGGFMTINSIIGACFSAHVSEQRKIEEQQERIEDAE